VSRSRPSSNRSGRLFWWTPSSCARLRRIRTVDASALRGRGELGGHTGLPNRRSGFDAHRPLSQHSLGALVQRYGSPVLTRETRVRLPDALRTISPHKLIRLSTRLVNGRYWVRIPGVAHGSLAQRSEQPTLTRRVRGSNPRRSTLSPEAQQVARPTVDREVPGSSPGGGATSRSSAEELPVHIGVVPGSKPGGTTVAEAEGDEAPGRDPGRSRCESGRPPHARGSATSGVSYAPPTWIDTTARDQLLHCGESGIVGTPGYASPEYRTRGRNP
jgi:hypothetical protein